LPLVAANTILGWNLAVGVILLVVFVVYTFASSKIFSIQTVMMIYDTFLLSVYIFIMLWIGCRINSYQYKHSILLLKEKIKLSIHIERAREEGESEEDIHKLKSCRELLAIESELIERQDADFHILGLSFSEGTLKVILGLAISITVAIVAKLGVDFTSVD
jgi:hypothetical protein